MGLLLGTGAYAQETPAKPAEPVPATPTAPTPLPAPLPVSPPTPADPPGFQPFDEATPSRVQPITPGVAPGREAPAATGSAAPAAPLAPSAPALPPPEPGMFRFGPFSEPVELTVLVAYVRDQLGLPLMAIDSGLQQKRVVIPIPLDIPREEVLPFLISLLEQNGYTITTDVAGIYIVRPLTSIQPRPGPGPFSTTRIIPTPGLRPSSLSGPIGAVTGGATNNPGAQSTPGGPAPLLVYVDDLGLIIATGSPRQLGLISDLVELLGHEQAAVKIARFEVENVSATFARDRIIELNGGQSGANRGIVNGTPQQPGGNVPQIVLGSPASLSNLTDRLTVDPQSNALLFRGRSDETADLRRFLDVVDVPNTLIPRWYAVGRAAQAVAQVGQQQGLGTVSIEVVDTGGSAGGGGFPQAQNRAGAPQGVPGLQQAPGVGPGFVIYTDQGGFMYRGTEAQHRIVVQLVRTLEPLTQAENIVFEFYKLKHSKSEDVAEIMHNLISNQLPSGTSPLLGNDPTRGGQSGRGGTSRGVRGSPSLNQIGNATGQTPGNNPALGNGPQGGEGEGLAALVADQNTFVLADPANNQVVVKASKRLQPQFARLIEKLDLRRPQVYIDCKIIAVTGSEDFRLAFETQLINANGTGGVVNTNFGLGSLPAAAGTGATGQPILGQKLVGTGLLGATAALIKSDQVPIIINALQTNVDTRILSTPQLLVDDNEEADVSSIDKVPYSTTTVTGQGTPITSTGGEKEAGTKLKVKPQISEGDYLKLEYEIELSSFTGNASANGLPPPSQENKIKADSVTIPSDTTIVVGGLVFDSLSNTVFKVPLLGDIPIIGQLFRDERKTDRKTTLYVFITPKIMKDPNFADLRLLTRGPLREVRELGDLPPPEPVRIDINDLGPGPGPLSPPPIGRTGGPVSRSADDARRAGRN